MILTAGHREQYRHPYEYHFNKFGDALQRIV